MGRLIIVGVFLRNRAFLILSASIQPSAGSHSGPRAMKMNAWAWCLLFACCSTAVFAVDGSDDAHFVNGGDTDESDLHFDNTPTDDEKFGDLEEKDKPEAFNEKQEEGSVGVPVTAFDEAPNSVKETVAAGKRYKAGRRSPINKKRQIHRKKHACKPSHYSSDNAKQLRLRKLAGCDEDDLKKKHQLN